LLFRILTRSVRIRRPGLVSLLVFHVLAGLGWQSVTWTWVRPEAMEWWYIHRQHAGKDPSWWDPTCDYATHTDNSSGREMDSINQINTLRLARVPAHQEGVRCRVQPSTKTVTRSSTTPNSLGQWPCWPLPRARQGLALMRRPLADSDEARTRCRCICSSSIFAGAL